MSTPTEFSVQRDIQDWLSENWDPGLSLVAWRERLVSAGWMVPSLTTRWFGRGLPTWANKIVADEIRAIGAVGAPLGAGMSLATPTLFEHGSDQLNEQLIRKTLTGEYIWCQLFSEPGAGSDLASLATTAVRDGDEWIVNGQKVWNTSAHHADYAILVARTDWDAPKHKGISYFILPMHQHGVEVRPIRQMNNHSSFNEVFMTDARIPLDHLVGEMGNGWAIARTTLAHERTFVTMRKPKYRNAREVAGRVVTEAESEAEDHFATYVWYPQRAGRADLLIERAQLFGCSNDLVVRQEIAKTLSFQRVSEWTSLRAQAARALGRPPGAEGSLGKLAASELARRCADTHALISGANGLLSAGEHANDSIVAEVLISTVAQSIAGGTDQIQRNIIGENILGLPREPSHERDTPFRDVKR